MGFQSGISRPLKSHCVHVKAARTGRTTRVAG
jgi:hypothetical protein